MYWDNLIVFWRPLEGTEPWYKQRFRVTKNQKRKTKNFSWLSLIIDTFTVNEKCQWKRRETRSELHILFGVKMKTKPSWIDIVNWIEPNSTEMSSFNCIQLTQCIVSIWFWHIRIHIHIYTHSHSHSHGLSYNNNPIGNKFDLKESIY